MDEMTITNAQYVLIYGTTVNGSITATIDGVEMSVPMRVGNRHYDEIVKQVEAGTLIIQEADAN